MKPMRLYTAFHANLDFSALPDADRPLVLERCYWPLLALPEELGIPIGFEMSARTLRALQVEDPDWVKKVRGLAERGLIEAIGSGWAQVVAPLTPTEVNRANLFLGNQLYETLLGFVPETFFVGEQTWSDGLAPLFREAGARRVIMEWNNPAAAQPSLRPLRCQPARLRCAGGPGPVLLWNDSIVFQKMQRVAHGQIPEAEIFQLLERLLASSSAEALCIYGGDVEIFDYRPSRAVPRDASGRVGAEMERLIEFFRRLAGDSRFEFVLPRDVVSSEGSSGDAHHDEILPEVELGSSEDPIPCKKQPRYNPTRWAVSGRDGFGMNTRCHALLRSERAARRLNARRDEGNRVTELVDLWRSDFRTRATEEKVDEFGGRAELATQRSQALLESVMPPLAEAEDLLLVNPGSRDWQSVSVEVPLRFEAGRIFELEIRSRRGWRIGPENYQLEVSGRHRDGSIREETLVLEPELEARGVLGLSFSPIDRRESESEFEKEGEWKEASTDHVAASFLPHRGAGLYSLAFPVLGEAALLGTIPHGTFDEIAYTPDFYSGHVLAVSENGTKETDLRPVDLRLDPEASGPLRTTLRAEVESCHGPWRKTYRLYRRKPRLDLIHDLSFNDARLASLRLGVFTLLPDGWNESGLRYGTINGGWASEWRGLGAKVSIEHSRAVSSSVSATSCLGATEGWLAIEDDQRGILIQGDRTEAAVAPMLDFRRVDDRFFCRISHSAAETDETRATFMRGRKRFAFSIEGYGGSQAGSIRAASDAATQRAQQRHHGLVYRTTSGVGISGGL